MTIEELKQKLENNEILPNILIFKCSSEASEFIFYQYIHKYSININKDIVYIDDINKLYDTSFLFGDSRDITNIYIYDIQKLDVLNKVEDIVWVKCKTINKKVKETFKDNIIDIPKLESWHIKDYINTNLPELDEIYQDLLYNNYKSNLFRLDLEIQKLKLFDDKGSAYENIKDQLYIDSSEYSIFDLTNCILKRDIKAIKNINVLDIDAFGLIQILTKNFRYIIDIQLAHNPTPEYVGISSKQFWAIKNYSCGYYTKDELVEIYKFLLSLDNKIKSGYISTSIIIDYVIGKIMLMGS